MTYSPLTSTIGSSGLNFRVRNENGCDPTDKPPEQKTQYRFLIRHKENIEHKLRYRFSCFPADIGELVPFGSTHYCAYTLGLST